MDYQQPQPVYQQPMATQGMSVVQGGNRNAKNLPVDAEGRKWSNGLCDCCGDAGTCVLALCCPCVVYAQNKHRYEHLSQQGVPDPEAGGGFCTGDCWVHALLSGFTGLGWILQIGTRSNTRLRYTIKGGGCNDCLVNWCCSPCALTQESREIELEERSFGGGVKN
ncbi:Protein PLANT CADMIUM RESISTANCE 1 [Hypsizygus marmoreus]|uniref:Protein PLANT CADMIUM RESISTANCE 1 n=1 Tax=Hypsizygus marmoreus TaxID=39966 RepID=A0A369K3L4_HYPMA|nr:Protein PLANT CADMIUM RESISTANCE 1 [Hypsizygus marmoreus]